MKENGESRGYGYIQFETKEGAEKCIAQANGLLFKEKPVVVEVFKRRTDRTLVRKNIYVRNLPVMPEA